MHYKNSILVYKDKKVVEIPCDKKIYLKRDLSIGTKENSEGYVVKENLKDRIIWNNGSEEISLNPYELIRYPQNEEISIVHVINDRKKYITKGFNEISIGSSSKNNIYIKSDKVLDLKIVKSKFINLNNTSVYINGKFVENEEINLAYGDMILVSNLKITYYKDSLLIDASGDIYKSNLLEADLDDNEFEGYPDYKRSPRIVKVAPTEEVNFMKPPSKIERKKGQLAKILVPPIVMLIITVVISIYMKRGIYIIMSIAGTSMTAIFSVTSYFSEKEETTRKNKLRLEVYKKYLLDLRKKLDELKNKQIESLRYHNPSLKEIEKMITNNSSRIYERSYTDDDFLNISIGNAEIDSSYKMKMPGDSIELEKDDLVEDLRKIYVEFNRIGNMPVTIDLKKSHLGIVGEKRYIHEQLNIIFAQLTLFQSYNDLEIIFIHNEKYRDDFTWLRWYPHFKISAINVRGLVDTDRMRDQVLGNINKIFKDRDAKHKEKNEKMRYLPHYLFVIDEPSLIMNHSIMEYLQRYDSDLGFSIIYTSLLKDNLPENIRTIMSIDNYEDGRLIINEGKLLDKKMKLNHVDVDLEKISRRLSSLNHVKGKLNQIPNSISFFEMYKINNPREFNIEKRWMTNEAHKTLAVPLGVRGKEDYVYLNLHEKAHGPHGLVAGTTGSGKSEIVQSYILSLAVNYHPYEVGFLLIDYKGGGMASLFKDLPHLLGTITNLDGAESMRAMASIKSELARRQQIFNEYNVNHINQYSKLFKTGKAKEAIPHLFLISDEFAELKKEQPDFMRELVSAARIGRSLGIHLILATQKPTGVVDEQIWSNSKFKLALKVQNESDSNEILKTPDAAKITQAGRAYLQVGNNEIYELFQSAWSGAIYDNKEEDNSADNRVYLINHMGQGELLNNDLSVIEEDLNLKSTELDVSVNYMRKVFKKLNLKEVKKPWLPPLERKIVSPYINENNIIDVDSFNEIDTNVAIGLVDIPELQDQREYGLDFTKDGNFIVFSSTGLGKTTTLTNIILSLAVKNSPRRVQFYILDFGNSGLVKMKDLPHVREYIKSDDAVKFEKFCKIIDEEVKRRKRLFGEYSVANFNMFNEVSDNKLEAIFIVIDNYDVIKEMSMQSEEFILRITRDGSSMGIFVIVSTSRQNAIKYSILNNFKNRIAHYIFDEMEVNTLIGRGSYKLTEVPGRALVKLDNVNLMQAYTPVDFNDELDYAKNVKNIIEKINNSYTGEQFDGIRMLPEVLTINTLREFDSKNNNIRNIPIGLDEEDVMPQYVEVSGGIKMIVGGQQTGKTNLLKVLINQTNNIKSYLIDSKNLELYDQREKVCKYISSPEQIQELMNEVENIVTERKGMFEEYRINNSDIIPKIYYKSLDPIIVFIDNCDSFISQVATTSVGAYKNIFENAIMVGVTFIVTSQSSGLKGYDELSKLFKTSISGVILGNPNEQAILTAYVRNAKSNIDTGYVYNKGQVKTIKIPKA